MARIVTTEAQLLEAWEVRRRPDWPATFDAAMAHPMYSRLVRMHAAHTAVMEHIAKRSARVTPGRPLPGQQPTTTRPTPAPIFDRKRAASGEREDD